MCVAVDVIMASLLIPDQPLKTYSEALNTNC